MSREVRRVPKDWRHPKRDGRYWPLYGDSYSKDAAQWDEEAAQWAKGLRRDYEDDTLWVPHEESYPFTEWDGERPKAEDYMPDWPESERTHLQMYESTSEGTPISPVMETPEELARWLVDNEASAFGGMKATYEQWLAMAKRGWAPSAMAVDGRLMSGVAATKP